MVLERAAAILHRHGRTRATVNNKKKEEKFSTFVRDPEGEKRVGEIAAQCRAKGVKFVDKEFPADTKALFIDPSNVSASMGKVKDELGAIRWMRPDQMGDPNEKPQVFAEGIDPEDINQGSIGDCYFLAALAICATREELILDLIVEDFAEDGIYGVKLCVLGQWKTIIVDDLLPCRNESGKWMPIFARWKGTKETWAMIAEKAWAKFHGSYEAIGGGRTEDALAYLSGGFSMSNSLNDKDHSGSLWDRLVTNHRLNSQDMGVFISTSGVDESVSKRGGLDDPNKLSPSQNTGGLVSGHAYSILNLAEVEGGHKIIQLRNPWGSYEWDGDWGDKSPLWTPARKSQVGFVDAEDGSFWMSLDDYRKNFSLVGICKTIPSAFNQIRANGEWKSGSTAGGPKDNMAGCNPTYKLTNTDREVWFQIEQPDIRGKPYAHFTRCFVYILKESDVKTDEITGQRSFSPAQSVVPTISLGDERQKTIECTLEPSEGPYLVVVAPWRAGIEGPFQVSLASPKSFTFARLPDSPPTAEQIKTMTKLHLPKECIVCQKAVDLHSHVSLKGIYWHPSPSCNKCAGCQQPFALVTASGAAAVGSTSLKIHDIGYDTKWGAYCFSCFNPRFGEQCFFCKKPLQHHEHDNDPCVALPGQGKMHQECIQGFHASSAEKCGHCGEPVAAIGKFGGQYYTSDMGSANGKLPNGEKPKHIHIECWSSFEQSRALKCLQCREPIFEIPGKFSGSFLPVETPVKGGVHAECLDVYNREKGPKCIHCGEPAITIPGKFSGRCYVMEGDKKLHEECHTAYQHSLAKKCTVCKDVILPIPGKFSGNYFQKDGQDIHAECKEAYLISKAKRCGHCSEPIIKKEGKYSGSYFPINDAVSVHEECFKAYSAANK